MKHTYAVLKLWLEEEIKTIGEEPTGKEAKAECILILAEVNKGIKELQQLNQKQFQSKDGTYRVTYVDNRPPTVYIKIDEILGENKI